MRRTTITLSAALMLLAFAPAAALARHHDRRHHSRVRHARIERFGPGVTSASTTSGSVDNAGTVQSFSGESGARWANGALIMFAEKSYASSTTLL